MKPPQKLIDDFIKQGSKEVDSAADLPEHHFSNRYYVEEAKLLKKHKKNRQMHKAILAAGIIVIIGTFVACTAIFGEAIKEAFYKYTSYSFVGGEYDITDLEINFEYIPAGYSLLKEYEIDAVYMAKYSKGRDEIDLTITVNSKSDRQANINNENVTEAQYYIDDKVCTVIDHGNGDMTLYYNMELATIMIETTLSTEEAIEIIKNIKIIRSD